MTRKHLNRQVRTIACSVIFVLLIALTAKFLPFKWANGIYEYINDMSILILTVASVFLANAFQKRSVFVQSLREQWREMVEAKSALLTYIDRSDATVHDYLDAYAKLSRSIDSMRIVYRNVGETKKLIGLYPYESLHDMRRAFEAIDPRKGEVNQEHQDEAWAIIRDAFKAVRERFLDELQLFEPTYPIVKSLAKRKKVLGADRRSLRGLETDPIVTKPPEPPAN